MFRYALCLAVFVCCQLSAQAGPRGDVAGKAQIVEEYIRELMESRKVKTEEMNHEIESTLKSTSNYSVETLKKGDEGFAELVKNEDQYITEKAKEVYEDESKKCENTYDDEIKKLVKETQSRFNASVDKVDELLEEYNKCGNGLKAMPCQNRFEKRAKQALEDFKKMSDSLKQILAEETAKSNNKLVDCLMKALDITEKKIHDLKTTTPAPTTTEAPKPTTTPEPPAPEPTTPAPTTPAPEPSTSETEPPAPEPTTSEPEPTTSEPEPTTSETEQPTDEPSTTEPDSTTPETTTPHEEPDDKPTPSPGGKNYLCLIFAWLLPDVYCIEF